MLLGAVEGVEESDDVALVGGLGGGEAALVDAVVDQVVLPLVGGVDVGAQGLRVEVHGAVFLVGDNIVELGAEHAEDLAALVVDDGLLDFVVEHGHGEAAGVVRVRREVHLAEMGEPFVALDGVRDDVLALGVRVRGRREPPPLRSHVPVHGAERDDVF